MIPNWKREHHGGASVRSVDESPTLNELLVRSSVQYVQGKLTARIRLLVLCSHADATVDIAFLRPLAEAPDDFCAVVLDEAGVRAATLPGADMSFHSLMDLMAPTHIVLSRVFSKHADFVKELLEHTTVPTICFLDDDLLNVPEEVGEAVYQLFQEPDRRETLLTCVTEADLLLLSTPALGKSISEVREDKPMAVNRIYRSVSQQELELVPDIREDGDVIGYMASQSHAQDFMLWLPAIISLMIQRPNLRFETFGTIAVPPPLQAFGDRVISHGKASSYESFIQRLRDLSWSVGLAPLAPTEFNSNKANTKWVEYSLAGIPTLAADSAVYAHPAANKACLVANRHTLEAELTRMLDNVDLRRELHKNSLNLLMSEYSSGAYRKELSKVLSGVSRGGHQNSAEIADNERRSA